MKIDREKIWNLISDAAIVAFKEVPGLGAPIEFAERREMADHL